MSEKEIVEIVARYLKDKHPGGATLEALTQGVRHEQDWWYVPVRPSAEPARRYEYYEALADVEAALEDSEHLTVLLLPADPETEEAKQTDILNEQEGWPADVPNGATTYNANRYKLDGRWHIRHQD